MLGERELFMTEDVPMVQVETLKATTGGKPITYKIAYDLPVTVMREWGLYISKPRCAHQVSCCVRLLPLLAAAREG